MTERMIQTQTHATLEQHRTRLARMVARAPVHPIPCTTEDMAALELAEEIAKARRGRNPVRYRVSDKNCRAAIAAALGACGYDVDEFMQTI